MSINVESLTKVYGKQKADVQQNMNSEKIIFWCCLNKSQIENCEALNVVNPNSEILTMFGL